MDRRALTELVERRERAAAAAAAGCDESASPKLGMYLYRSASYSHRLNFKSLAPSANVKRVCAKIMMLSLLFGKGDRFA
jgi:hypothetical protein